MYVLATTLIILTRILPRISRISREMPTLLYKALRAEVRARLEIPVLTSSV